MADNRSPNPKRTEIVLAWLGMAGAVALLWWLVRRVAPRKRMRRRQLLPAPRLSSDSLGEVLLEVAIDR